MKIYEDLWKSMNIYGTYLFQKKKMGYILYSKNINASHICPPKKNQLFKQRKWKSRFSGKHGLWPAKYGSKSLFWWKPEMIPGSFRSFCPSRFDWKPRWKFSFWRKCWKCFFQKSRAYFGDILRWFDVVSAANSIYIWSGLDQNSTSTQRGGSAGPGRCICTVLEGGVRPPRTVTRSQILKRQPLNSWLTPDCIFFRI